MILNLHYARRHTTNLGEYFTQPADYFHWPDEMLKAPLFSNIDEQLASASLVIIGGSGIHNDYTWARLREVVAQTSVHIPIVIWGMGINDHGRLDRNYNDILYDLERRSNVLIGLRDSFYKTHLPCVSCLRSEFDTRFPVQFDVGLYVHKQFDLSLPYYKMSNKLEGDLTTYFWRVLKFLGSCDTVVTNTYHGAYWATLLNRRVIVVAPFSNKFLGLKYEPIIIQDAAMVREVLRHARRYPQSLHECRTTNRAFYERVLAFRHVVSSSRICSATSTQSSARF